MLLFQIVAPTYGFVTEVTTTKITVYIPRKANHNVFAPAGGWITSIEAFQGDWLRPIFQSWVKKTGRVIIGMATPITPPFSSSDADADEIPPTTTQISELNDPWMFTEFWLEVGKPKYVTDRVRLDIDTDDRVEAGDKIGEILLGSLSEIHFSDQFVIEPAVQPGDWVVGGETIVATVRMPLI